MADRQAGKARKKAAKAGPAAMSAAPQPPPTPGPDLSIVGALEQERDALKRELDAAKARIAELEQAREQVLNRIDWIIDSLHNLTEK